MRLRRSVLSKPGIARKRRGKGFAYYGPDGDLLSDPETLQRIKELVIPPAWKNVWISPYPNGHIQAVGVDAAGRRSTSTTPRGTRSAPRRSSTAFWICPRGCRNGGPPWLKTSRAAV